VSTPDAAQILLVEDDDGLRNAYRIVLGARGFDVGTAATGEEALERLDGRAGFPAAIVADLGLPGLSGPELVRRLRAAAPDSALLVLTGTRDETVRQQCRRAGATRYLVKPVTGGDLEAALREACG
jgi:DNA-binding response OmpR family regulator